MKTALQNIDALIEPLRKLSNLAAAPLLDLSIRGYMAWIFFKSGQLKYDSWHNGDFDSVIIAFTDYHPVPGLDPTFLAYSATAGEIILPILLIIGLFGRFAAGGLLVMTLVIQYLIPAEYGIANAQHYFWMLLLAVPLIRGPGVLSIDALLRHFIWRGKKEDNGNQASFSPTNI